MGIMIAASLLAMLGVALELWASLVLGWRRALEITDAPPDPAMPGLVFAGPFRVVRHPQSLGLLLILGGAALAMNRPGMWVAAGLAAAIVVAMAVRHDRELARHYGEAHARYRQAVGLLAPSWRR
jgi:protein-S-isoprenylcysteine O-methyltransferase Ste14